MDLAERPHTRLAIINNEKTGKDGLDTRVVGSVCSRGIPGRKNSTQARYDFNTELWPFSKNICFRYPLRFMVG